LVGLAEPSALDLAAMIDSLFIRSFEIELLIGSALRLNQFRGERIFGFMWAYSDAIMIDATQSEPEILVERV